MFWLTIGPRTTFWAPDRKKLSLHRVHKYTNWAQRDLNTSLAVYGMAPSAILVWLAEERAIRMIIYGKMCSGPGRLGLCNYRKRKLSFRKMILKPPAGPTDGAHGPSVLQTSHGPIPFSLYRRTSPFSEQLQETSESLMTTV